MRNLNGLKIGFIKGGQLARMMLQALVSYNADISVSVLDSSDDCPCGAFSINFVQGDSLSFDDVYQFGKGLDVIVLEFEHVNVSALERLEKEGVKVLCNPADLRIIQDKGLQKEFLKKYDIPTAAYKLIDSKEEIDSFPVIQKTRTEGYDGGGVQKLSSMADMGRAFDGPSVIEECIKIKKELSVIAIKDSAGSIVTYPLIEQTFNDEHNIVEFIASPALVSKEIENQALNIAKKVVEHFHEGLYTVEMFLTEDDQVLVNEIAPRVHNSGHHTIEANYTSQFEQFVRLALGLPLGSVGIVSPAVTINLLYERDASGEILYQGFDEVLGMERVYLHLYGKKKGTPFRKIGHVTVLDENIEKAWEKAKKVKQSIKNNFLSQQL